MFSFSFDNIEVDFVDILVEIYLGTALIQQQQYKMPLQMAMAQINQLYNQIGNDPRPMRAVVKTPYYTEEGKMLINQSELFNNTYIKEFNIEKTEY